MIVDFDQIFNKAIKPAIQECMPQALSGDEERTGEIIYGPMFARPLLLDFVFAALTLDDAKEFE